MYIAVMVLVVRVEIVLSSIPHPVLSLETYGPSLNQPPADSVQGAPVRRAHSSIRKAACFLLHFIVDSQRPRRS